MAPGPRSSYLMPTAISYIDLVVVVVVVDGWWQTYVVLAKPNAVSSSMPPGLIEILEWIARFCKLTSW